MTGTQCPGGTKTEPNAPEPFRAIARLKPEFIRQAVSVIVMASGALEASGHYRRSDGRVVISLDNTPRPR